MKLAASLLGISVCAMAIAAAMVAPAVAQNAPLDRTVLPIAEPVPSVIT
jgi:hypothetical protein